MVPEIFYEYESDNEQYHEKNESTHNFEAGIFGRYSNEKLYIQAHMAYHLIDGVNYEQSQLTASQGLGYLSQDPGLNKNQRNYYLSDLQIQYGNSSTYIYLNKWNKHWGPGVRSLTVSNKIPTFPYFGFRWSVTDQINLDYFHGQLRSGIVDSSYIDYFGTRKSTQVMRNIAGHRLDWQPNKNWIFSISELVIYANRSLEIGYMLPFIPFFPIQNYLNDTDNILMSADVQYFHANNIRIYSAFIMDEWSPPYTFSRDNHNWFGWQVGIDWKDIYLKQDQFRLEYTWTDHRIYRHRFEVNDFYSWDYPIGFWAGPHAEEIYMDYSFYMGVNRIKILFSNAKRGEYTDSMRVDQYGRPSNIAVYERFGTNNTESCGDCIGSLESKQLIRISVNRKILEKVELFFQYTYVDWGNAGFNPSSPLADNILPDIIKHSIGFRLQYRY